MTDFPAYEQCPKCRHAPLPADQALPVACPDCGLVFAKFAAAAARTTEAPALTALEPGRRLLRRIWSAMFRMPPTIEPAAFWGRCGLLLLFAVWGLRLVWLDHRTGGVGSSFLHGPLLVFHEAGHVIFMPFGEFIAILGGTLGQLLMPIVLIVAFLVYNRDPFGAAIATWFFGVSLLDVAPYVYDALDPQLVLLGGQTGEAGGHDWIFLLGETGLLRYAQTLGGFVHTFGALCILLSIGWAGRLLLQQRAARRRMTGGASEESSR